VATQLAASSIEITNNAGEFMGSMMGTMSELKASSDTVGRIAKTIDELAFQTNLLAINATVEAARAGGEAGRSFGVVAQEVRDLALKSAKSASDTTDIIQKNIQLTNTVEQEAMKVVELAKKSGVEMHELGKLIGEISAASEEQASGIKQINAAISQMEKVTQENAAVAQENAASSNAMQNELAALDQVISMAGGILRDGVPAHYNNRSSLKQPEFARVTVKKAEPVRADRLISEAEKIIPLDDSDDF